MNAKPNLNGNSPESFLKAGRKLHSAAIFTKHKMRKNLAEITHGRNYQHCSIFRHEARDAARTADLARIAHIIEALDDLEAIGRELHDTGSAG
jgi:hypothetical protein